MTRHFDATRGLPLPEYALDALFDLVSTYVSPNFKVALLNPTTVQVAASTENDVVTIAVQGRIRYRTTAVQAAMPGTPGAGTYDVYVTGSDNSYSNSPQPDTDNTVYDFGLEIRTSGTPATDIYRKVATVTWNGTAITGVTQLVGAATPGPGSILTAMLADLAVTTPKLADDSVTGSKIAAGAVGSSEIADGSVGSAEIAVDAVGASEIAAGAVGTPELADNSVVDTKIAPGAVTSSEILDGAVNANKLANGAVTPAKVQAGSAEQVLTTIGSAAAWRYPRARRMGINAFRNLVPGSTVQDGDVVVVDLDEAGVAFRGLCAELLYRADLEGVEQAPWEVLAAPILFQTTAGQTSTTGASYGVTANPGPTAVLPIGGEWFVEWSAVAWTASDGNDALMAVESSVVLATDTWALRTRVQQRARLYASDSFPGLGAGDSLTAFYRSPSGPQANFQDRTMKLTLLKASQD